MGSFLNVNVHDLAEAVQRGDRATVRLMLNAKPDLINKDLAENNEHRAIHFAVLGRDAAMVKLLMEAGADARKGIYPHRDATSALAIARDREYDEIAAILEQEERLRRDLSGANPLHIAAQEGNLELVSRLLQERANVNQQDIRGHTPLDRAALAANERFPETARLLLEHGAEMTLTAAVALANEEHIRQAEPSSLRRADGDGGLLTLAVHHGQIGMVNLLLDLGADVDERVHLAQLEEPVTSWGMPLWTAASENKYEICELLLNRGADPNANVYASGWPLSRAWDHEDGRVKNLLLARGAKLPPYMVSSTHNVAEAKRLLEADPSEELASELLWSAADHGCPAIVELALPHIPWAPDDLRWHWVIIQPIRGGGTEGHFASMELLLKHGVNPNIARYGQTALHFAAAYRGDVSDENRARFAGMFIDAGASLTVRDDLLQSTPLGWACRWGRWKLAELLIERGAVIQEPDAEAWATPRAWARKMGHVIPPELLQ